MKAKFLRVGSSLRIFFNSIHGILANQLLVGVLIGAIAGFLGNYITFQYQERKEVLLFKDSLKNEVAHNFEFIKTGDESNNPFWGAFQSIIWDSGLENGIAFRLPPDEFAEIQNLYLDIKRTNLLRDIHTEHSMSRILISSDIYGEITYLENQLENTKNLSARNSIKERLVNLNSEFESELEISEFSQEFLSTTAQSANTALKPKFEKVLKIL